LSSLNPSLEDVRHCPRCGSAAVEVRFPRSIHCATCGYAAFYNPKPVACAIVRDAQDRVVLARRGFEPGAGRWSMPGGFVDLGESVEDAVRRELREELALEVELEGLVGVYSRAEDRIVLIVHAARALGVPQPSEEAPEVRAFAADAIPWDELAFWSDERALRDLLTRPSGSATPPG
jgi:8-oxo-dGTP diphosphatase